MPSITIYTHQCILAFHAGPTYDRKTDSNTVSDTSVEHSSPKLEDPKQNADFDADQSQRELGMCG